MCCWHYHHEICVCWGAGNGKKGESLRLYSWLPREQYLCPWQIPLSPTGSLRGSDSRMQIFCFKPLQPIPSFTSSWWPEMELASTALTASPVLQLYIYMRTKHKKMTKKEAFSSWTSRVSKVTEWQADSAPEGKTCSSLAQFKVLSVFSWRAWNQTKLFSINIFVWFCAHWTILGVSIIKWVYYWTMSLTGDQQRYIVTVIIKQQESLHSYIILLCWLIGKQTNKNK